MNNKFEAIEKASKGEITIEMRPVYIINGAKRAYLSERSALNKLSSIIAEREVRKQGFETNYEDIPVTLEDGTTAVKRGEPTEYFMGVKEGILIALHEHLKKEKQIIKLQEEYAKAVVDHSLLDDKVELLRQQLQAAIDNRKKL
ncbi:hypothetical protein [Providencia sp. Me31A]|uniref:hypothetical protein n=1 Tax=Providencia sp. Me31A TaxID=3392637 RepID=UPI003D2E057F